MNTQERDDSRVPGLAAQKSSEESANKTNQEGILDNSANVVNEEDRGTANTDVGSIQQTEETDRTTTVTRVIAVSEKSLDRVWRGIREPAGDQRIQLMDSLRLLRTPMGAFLRLCAVVESGALSLPQWDLEYWPRVQNNLIKVSIGDLGDAKRIPDAIAAALELHNDGPGQGAPIRESAQASQDIVRARTFAAVVLDNGPEGKIDGALAATSERCECTVKEVRGAIQRQFVEARAPAGGWYALFDEMFPP